MKNKVLIGLMMMSCFFVVNGMDVDTLEFETNGDNSSDKTLEIFNKEHPEFIQLLSEDHRDNVIKIMQEKRQNLVSHVMSNKESISSQELTKQYGNNALDYFKSFTLYGSALLDIMNDKVYLEKSTNRVKEKNQLKLAILVNTIDNLESKIDKKKKNKKIHKEEASNTVISQNTTKKSRFIENGNEYMLLKDALCSQYGSLYRAFPHGDDDLILELFIEKYPKLATEIINQKTQKKVVHSRTRSVINVEQLGSMAIQNSESLTKVYEKYKVLKALLESMGINVGAIQTAVSQDLQIIVDGLIEKTKNLDVLIHDNLQKCCNLF